MSRFSDLIQNQAENPSVFIKAINYAAALLGIGTFLQLVNLAVGALSAMWLTVQLYGYVRYELPHKRARLRQALRDLGEPSDRGSL